MNRQFSNFKALQQLQRLSLCVADSHSESESHRELQAFEFEGHISMNY